MKDSAIDGPVRTTTATRSLRPCDAIRFAMPGLRPTSHPLYFNLGRGRQQWRRSGSVSSAKSVARNDGPYVVLWLRFIRVKTWSRLGDRSYIVPIWYEDASIMITNGEFPDSLKTRVGTPSGGFCRYRYSRAIRDAKGAESTPCSQYAC